MDGTLLDLNFDNQFWLHHVPVCHARRHGISKQASLDIILPRMQKVRGSLDWYDIHYWSRELGLDILTLKQDLVNLIKIRPGVHEFLNALREQNKTVWLATNAHHETIPVKLDRTDLWSYFHQIISSSEVGFAKESTNFWYHVNKRHPFNPQKSVFIDDNLAVLRVAKRYGVRHLLAIGRPDLSGEELIQNEFPTVDHFHEITPLPNRP